MDPTPPATPGQLIRAARVKAGLTQQQLADRLGCAQPTVAQVEADRSGITLDRLGRLAEALGVPVTDLVPAQGRREGRA